MSKLNKARPSAHPEIVRTQGRTTVEQAEHDLRRSVACCLLWEDTFYESGEAIADRIKRLVAIARPEFTAALAFEARTKHYLRHAPLLLVRELARHPTGKALVGRLLPDVATRADMLAEFVKLYWATQDKKDKKTLSAQVKKGLAAAFKRFDAFALAKNDHQDAEVKLRDVAFLAHPQTARERTELSNAVLKERAYANGRGSVVRFPGSTLDRLVEGTLETPDTWEVALSAAKGDAEKRAVWARLLAERKLGALAWLRNLRNLEQAGLRLDAEAYALELDPKGILPFQFFTAARIAPWAKNVLEPLMFKALEAQPRLPGLSVLLMDVSGSMSGRLSAKGEATRLDAAAGLMVMAREVCERVELYTFSDRLAKLDPRSKLRGFALGEACINSQPHSGTDLAGALRQLVGLRYEHDGGAPERIMVITDEQSQTGIKGTGPFKRGYVMNVASYERGVATGDWVTITGWSPAVLNYVAHAEGVGAVAEIEAEGV